MDAAPSAELVYQGICTLFYNKDPKEKDKANKWLEGFQKSIYSWKIADELLQQKRDLHSCYFAAQTMRNKIQNSFIELPVESHTALRDSLLAHISQITPDTDAIIVTQLSLAIADLALLMAVWQDPVGDLLEMFSQKPQSIWPLLEILTVMPEEIGSRFLRLGENRRTEVQAQMKANSEKVLKFLCYCTQMNPPENIWNGVLRCFANWLTAQAMLLQNLQANPVVKQTFQFLSENGTSARLHDSATECLCSMLTNMEMNNNNNRLQNEAGGVAMVELQLFQNVCALEGAYQMSVAHEDVDKTMNYCRIFSTLCEEFLNQMTSEKENHYSVKALELLLLCVGHFDYEVAEITFHFWYRLSEALFGMNNDALTARFKPHIERLLAALYRHVQIDTDHEGLIDENDNFNDFRRKVSDLIKDVAFIVGSGACFKQMFLLLQTSNTTWESTEAALFIMQNVAKNVLPDENEIVPKVIEAILNLPENAHIAVRYTSILLLGELCDWIDYHRESLEAVLNFLLYALQQKNGLAAAAAVSLTSICAACRTQMTLHINGLIEIARCLDSFEISNDLAIGLLKSISLVLTRLPREKSEPAMHDIIGFQLQPLAHLIETSGDTKSSPIRKGERNDPAYWIDRACAVIRHTDPELNDDEIHPTVNILAQAWPLIAQTMTKYQTDLRLMERTCRLIRYALRMVHKQAYMLVEPMVKLLVELYAAQHHSCFLYLGSVLVDEFAKMDECTAGLLEMLNAFIAPTFELLQMENGLQSNPDIVDDFFRLCARFIECCPLQFLRSELVSPIFQCAMLACTMDHREANSSAMKFFCLLLKWGHSSNHRFAECRPLVKTIAQTHGELLVRNLIYASVFYLSSYMLPDVAEVLTELKAVVSQPEMELYLRNALNALPKENSGGYVTVTQEQLDKFNSDVLRSDTSKNVSVALRTFTRLFR